MATSAQQGEIVTGYQQGSALYTGTLLTNPDQVLQQRGNSLNIYTELLRDDQVGPCFEQRRRAVVQSEWTVEPASDSAADKAAAADITEQLSRVGIDRATDRMLFGLLYGYSVAEAIWAQDGNRVLLDAIKVRAPSRFRYDVDLNLRYITWDKPQGKIMPKRKFWTFSAGGNTSDNPYGLGLGHSLYWPVFFKRNAIKFWMVFLDKFAQPTAVGKLPAGKSDDRQEMRRILEILGAIQTDSAVTVPDDVEIDLIEAARSGTADYSTVVKRMDDAIAKIILSQTMTNSNGSSKAQATVHKEVRDEVVKSDADLISESLNSTIITWLTEWNHPGATPPKLWRKTEPEEDLATRADRDQKIAALGYEPTEEYIAETYGPGWRKKQAPAAPPQPTGPLPANFTEISRLAQERVGHRADQQRLKDAAEHLATQYDAILGDRVRQLIQFLDDTQDLQTFRERLTELFADAPSPDNVDKVRNANFFARLMGHLRGTR